jgi:hypothetical protein
LFHTGAYWVSGLAARPGAAASIDVSSLAHPVRTTVGTAVNSAGQNFTSGADDCGANPGAQSEDVWVEHGLNLASGPKQATSNGMTVSLVGLESATLDLAGMGLSTGSPIRLDISGDGPAQIHLVGPWNAVRTVTVYRDGVRIGTLPVTSGAIVLGDNFSREHHYLLTP